MSPSIKRFAFTAALATGLSTISAHATLLGHWAFDEPNVAANDPVVSAVEAGGNSDLDASPIGSPVYSSDIPGPYIYDPLSLSNTRNRSSMNATANAAGVLVPGNSNGNPLDTASFTAELFLKLDTLDLPTSFNYMLNRRGGNPALGWQIDYNAPFFSSGAANGNAGKIRSRSDTAAQANQSNQGGRVDDGLWHHVALVYDSATSSMTVYTDYIAGPSRTINGTLPNEIDIKIGGSGAFGLLIDEVRLHDRALAPSEFLVASTIPEPGSAALIALGLLLCGVWRRSGAFRHDAPSA